MWKLPVGAWMPIMAEGWSAPCAADRNACSTASMQDGRSSRRSTSERVRSRVLTMGGLDDTVEAMNSSDVTTAQPAAGRGWLLLIHQVPPKPDYLRVKV